MGGSGGPDGTGTDDADGVVDDGDVNGGEVVVQMEVQMEVTMLWVTLVAALVAAVQTVVAVTRQEPVQGRRAESEQSETGHKAGAMMVRP